MKVSLNWIRDINKRYGSAADPAPDGIDALVEKIGAQLGAVEEVIDLGQKYQGVVVAKVVSCEKHPNADKLSVCLIDDGGVVKSVKRNKDGYVQVVCGAPNVAPTLAVAWIPPGVVVPSTFDADPYKLEVREIRGVISNGMLASPKELALGDSHEGLLIIDEPVKPGAPFAKAYGLDDYIIDIENKMFTHRPDLFGMLGIARELAGIQGHSFKSPAWYREDVAIKKSRADGLKLRVRNDLPKLVPRFIAVVIKDVKVTDSPGWLQSYLSRVGIRPINNIVDLTNFIMHETAQPLHAYDYDKLGDQIVIRKPKTGETLDLIGGKTIKLQPEDIVIASADKAVGLGGVMGGAGTQVDSSTTNIVLEVATFDMNTVRKTAMAHGLFTDAATRFTKNQSPRQNAAVIAKAADDVLQIAGGRIVSDLLDNRHFDAKPPVVGASAEFINGRLGLDLPSKKMKSLLENVEFKVSEKAGQLQITVPFWRTDIDIPEDIVEEIGRLYGYDHLPLALPLRTIKAGAQNPDIAFKNRLRSVLTSAGGSEVLTYSFIPETLLENSGQDKKQAYHIRNALSPDLQYYRLSLVPSLLEKVHPNIKGGYDEFALFELGVAHIRGVDDKEGLPAELPRTAAVITKRQTKGSGAPYYAARTYADHLLQDNLGVQDIIYTQLTKAGKLPNQWAPAVTAFESQRSAVIYSGKEVLGLVGEPSLGLRKSLKLPDYTSQIELDSALLQKLTPPLNTYKPLGRYPSLAQDLCLRAASSQSYEKLSGFVGSYLQKTSILHGFEYEIMPLDIFQKTSDNKFKQTTWRLTFTHADKTLTTVEINKILDGLAAEAKKSMSVERV